VKYYLWAIGDWLKAYRVGELLCDRYFLKQPQIVLDTKPGLPTQGTEEVPDRLLPYLKLFPYRLHIPQIYSYIPSPDDQLNLEIWLLEYGSIPTDASGELKYPELLPQLTQMWAEASALRQLNWLWQISQLWQPLQSRGVASSLLNPSLLRVNGRTIQLLELQTDTQPAPSLQQLGQFWSQWIANASPHLSDFLQELCQHLEQGIITQSQQLLDLLARGSYHCGRSQQRIYQIFTATDAGPTRDHNEDACYPPSGEFIRVDAQENPLAIVCDGIGGQDGGEIASQLAIKTLLEEVKHLSLSGEWNPQRHIESLDNAICATNDLISQRNDREQRQDRQRMGTTLVMSFADAHEMYLAHVGDSRAYWITPTSCHQVTVDDDLASREVRLGYLLYRDAIQYPNSGALVQALGMSASTSLRPTVQRLIIDEDCVFLLCSDGLSDYDRVEQYWDSEIVPILSGEKDVAEVGKRLLEIANQQNGHDNVTVALVYCQVQPKEEIEDIPLAFPTIDFSVAAVSASQTSEETIDEITTQTPTQPFSSEDPPQPKQSWRWFPLFITLGLVGLGAVVLAITHSKPSESPLTPSTPSPSIRKL
ncbi:MAG: PP2C family protein-serine/threonine phosphatase, partial [Microcystaceae cyanobacterium]